MAAIIKNVKNMNILKSQAFGFAWVFGEISQMLGYLFPKCLGICEIPQMFGYLGNFQDSPNSLECWCILNILEIPKCLGIWEICQMPRFSGNFENFPNTLISG